MYPRLRGEPSPRNLERSQRPGVVFSPHSRLALKQGVNYLAKLIRPTLGLFPRLVACASPIPDHPPELLEDGATIAQRIIQVPDRDADMGAMLLRHALWHLTAHPFFVFLLRQFFLPIPAELADAAKIDRASEWGIFWRIYLPLSVPALATTALFTFMWNWNDFLGPLIFLNSQEKWTLALGLASFKGRLGAQWHLLMAATAIMLAPVVILFFLTQRTFIQGITMTGLKE